MPRRPVFGLWTILPAVLSWGCGGPPEKVGAGVGGPSGSVHAKPSGGLVFIGFDANEPLVNALRSGKLQGLVLQNPLKMGYLGVKTMVEHLEKKPFEREVSTGEAMVTPENMDQPEMKALLNPPKAENRSDAGSKGGKKRWRVMVIPKGTSHEFWKTIHAGALKAADELGNVEVIWQGPVKEDERTDQINLVKSAAASGVDGIVLAPLDAKALVEPVEQAIARGIPVVIIDSGLESSKPAAFVMTDNYHGGVLGAERLAERLKGEGRIILLRYAVGSASTEAREKGFVDTIKKYPKITYLSDQEFAGATADTAQNKSQNLVTRFRGQVDGIFCPNESSATGMLRALEGAGMLAARP
jgi:ribose transport system substrate-binding protein